MTNILKRFLNYFHPVDHRNIDCIDLKHPRAYRDRCINMQGLKDRNDFVYYDGTNLNPTNKR